jgi:uncharacterized membrane protein YeaQ/YmgE (transglycosylase-associated protein family)
MIRSRPLRQRAKPGASSTSAVQHLRRRVRLFDMGLLVLLVVVLVLGWFMLATIGFAVGLLLTLFVAGLVGWLADLVVPGQLPGGWIGAVLAGLIGGFIGRILFHAVGIRDLGFGLFGIELIPAFVGALVVVGAAELFTSRRRLA